MQKQSIVDLTMLSNQEPPPFHHKLRRSNPMASKVKRKKRTKHFQVQAPLGDFTLEKWFHLCIVSKDGKLSVYIEGVKK